MTRRWIVLTALAVVAFVAASFALSWRLARPPHRAITQTGPVAIVAMPTLTWANITPERTPTLWTLAQRGAVGNSLTRSVSAHSCSVHSWMSLSAGARATWGKAPGETQRGGVVGACPTAPAPVVHGTGAVLPQWRQWRAESLARPIRADLGLVASTLARRGQCVTAVGPLAAYGAADQQGRVASYYPSPAQADFERCPVNLVHLPTTDDTALRWTLDRMPYDTTLVVTGLADDRSPEQVRATIIKGPKVTVGLLRSAATRQPGLIQNVDLSALLLQRAVREPGAVLPEARRPVVQPEPDRQASIDHVRGVHTALFQEHRFVAPFFYTFVPLLLAGCAVGLYLVRSRRAGTDPALGRWWFRVLGVVAGSVPIGTFLVGLVPWWRSDEAGQALTAGSLAVAALIGAIALLGRWRTWVAGPAVVVAAVTWTVIALDITHGSRLQLISLMGLQPVYGGRFYGMGNVAYAMFASSGLFLAGLLAGRWVARGHQLLAALTVITVGVATVVVDGHPSWGADAGGPLALLPSFGYLALNAGGLRVTWKRILGGGSLAVVVVGGLGYLDYLRPPEYRTHIGEFVGGLIAEGRTTALQRNVVLNLQMLTSQWVNWFVPVLLALCLYVLVARTSRLGRPLAVLTDRVPLLGHTLAAITLCWLIGFLSNDSGTAVPPSGMIVIAPLTIALAAARGRTVPADVAARRPHATAPPAPAG